MQGFTSVIIGFFGAFYLGRATGKVLLTFLLFLFKGTGAAAADATLMTAAPEIIKFVFFSYAFYILFICSFLIVF